MRLLSPRHSAMFGKLLSAAWGAAVIVIISASAGEAQDITCALTTTPPVPAGATSAFGQDVAFSATARASCTSQTEPLPPTMGVCIRAQKFPVSGDYDFVHDADNVPYDVRLNNVALTSTPLPVFSGTIATSGQDFSLDYDVEASDYAGKAAGAYQSVLSWTIDWDPDAPPACN